MKMKTTLSKSLLIFGLVLLNSFAVAQVNLTEGLVAYYPFNGNTSDVSGNNNNGTPFGNVSYITDPFGNAGSAVAFGGTVSQGRVSIDHSATLHFTTGASFAFWARVSSAVGTFGNGNVGAGGSQCFFAKAGDAGGGFWQLSSIQSGNLRHQIGNNSVATLTADFSPYALSQWVHYIVTMDASGHRTYVNGVLQNSNEISANFAAMVNRPLVIGRFNSNWYPLNGGIDEFRVYNRVLTADEITALANNEIGDVTISYTNPIEVCAGSSLEVSYQATGSFLSTNQFQVQLSDRSGSFANPIVLRRVTGASVNETATVVLPAGLPSGTQYRIRLASTAPQEFSEPGLSFTVNGTTGNIPDLALFTYVGHVNGSDYFKSVTAQTWNNARTICLNNGGHLATIPNAEVNQLIFENAGNGRVYIGLNDIQTEGLFLWENGDRLSYTNWASGQPDNASNEDVVELRNDNGQWNDINGTAARQYFLELNPAGVTKTVCEGNNITLNAVSVSGATYSWTGPNGFNTSTQSPALNNITLEQAGVYTLQYTVNGCNSPVYQTRVEVIPMPKNIGETQMLPTTVAQGLQLHLPMNGNGNDVSGNNTNATLVGGITPMNDRFGNENGALQLNGTTGHLTLPAGVYFNGTDFSVNAWVRKVANNNWSRLFDFGNGQANQNILLGITSATTGRPATQIYEGTTAGPQIVSTQVLPNNQWQMLTYTWSNGGGQLFINGVMVAQGPQSTPEAVVRNINYIGRSNWNNDGYANAGFDDFRIYNRILSPEEIRLLTLEQPNPLQFTLDNPAICSGQTNNIILENTQPGLTYQLRLDSNNTNVGTAQTGTGGSLTFNVGTLNTTTDFHFLIRNSVVTCAEMISSIITVPVNALPEAPTTTGAEVCNEGSLTLHAGGAPGDGTYNWYTTATGGTPIEGETGNTFTTPTLNVTRTYFVSITNANGCEGPRTSVVAQVINPFAPIVDLKTGLLLHSKFEGNLLDSSGNNLNGGVAGGPSSFVEDRNGNTESALNLTNNAYINYGNPGIVQQLTNQVTISLWIKQTPSNFGFGTPLLNKWQGNGLYLGLDSYQAAPGQANQNRVRWRVNSGTVINSNTNVIHNQWHHIVVTYNGAQLRIYQNGVLTGQANHTGTITNTITNLQFGRQANGLGNATYRGDVDEVKLYNRALSPNEVSTLFNNESVAFSNAPLCNGEGNLALTTFDFPGATYQWTGPNGFSSTERNPPIIQEADAATYAGEYTLVVTSAGGCVSTPQTVQVVINPIPIAPEVQNATVCGSGNAVLQVINPPSGATFRWYTVPEGGTPIAGANAATLQINNVTQETIRYVSVVQNNCEGTRVPVTAFYFSNVNTALSINGSSVCQSEALAMVEIPQSETGVLYQVFLGNTAVSEPVTGTGEALQIMVNATLLNTGENTVTIRANFPNCGPVSMQQQPVIIRWQVTQPTISWEGALQICEGESKVLTATPGASYSWSNGASTPSITVTQSGTFTVTVTDANGCVSTSQQVVVTVNPVPQPVLTVNGEIQLCSGETTQLQASGGTTYLWSNGATTPNITVSQAGTYSFTAFNGTCEATSSSVTITVNATPNPVITVDGSLQLCSGDTTTLNASGGTTYLWSTGAIGSSITVSEAGTYFVTAFNGTCQATSSSVTVTVTSAPSTPGIISGNIQLCDNAQQTYSITPVSGATSYQWVIPQGWTGTSTTNTITVNPGTAGGQIRVVAINNCGQSEEQVLNVQITQVDNSVSQTGPQLTALATGATYQWFNCTTNQPIPGATQAVFTATEDGSYRVLVTQNGCSEFSSCLIVNTLSVNMPEINFSIQAYPNPAQHTIDVKITPAPLGTIQLSVWNVLGQQLSRQTPAPVSNGVYSLRLEHLPHGNYFIKVYTAGKEQVVPFIKN